MEQDTIVGSPSGLNHVLSGNPKTTICGQFRPGGWKPANEGGKMCKKCETRGAYIADSSRPMPNTLGGIRKP